MKIGYEAKRIYHNASGLGNYGRNLIRSLATFYPENKYHLYNPKAGKVPFGEFLPSVVEENPSIANPLYANIWRQRLMSGRVKKDGIEIFHGLAQELPLGLGKQGVKSVLTVHDLIFMRYPQLYNYIDRKIYIRKLKSACRRADEIVAISEQTKNDLVEFMHIPRERIKVIYQGVNPIYWKEFEDEEPQDVRDRYGLPKKFALFVGTLEIRKGVDKLLEAQLELDIPIVYVGRKTKFWEQMSGLKKYDGIRHLIFTPEVKEDELLAKLYRVANVFIYPSIFEGFGIPVLEALVSKTPVITSNNSSLPEVAGPSSILVNPEDQQEITAALKKVWDDEDLRKTMAETGYEFAQNFSDESIAKTWMRLYQSMKS